MPTAYFFNTLGVLNGSFDTHGGKPFVAAKPFFVPPSTGQTDKVTGDGFQLCQRSFKMKLVPHVPILIEDPDSWKTAAVATATSSSTPYFTKVTVTGQGKPLATTGLYSEGLNIQCNDPIPVPFGWSSQVYATVRTNMTLKDYAVSQVLYLWGAAFGFAKSEIVKKVTEKAGATPSKEEKEQRSLVKAFVDYYLNDVIKPNLPTWLPPTAVDVLTDPSNIADPSKAIDSAVQDFIIQQAQAF